jgi:hypothetical protein
VSRALSSFVRWTERETTPDRIVRFRIAFAVVWLAYDVLDLAFGGTLLGLLGTMAKEGLRPRGFVPLQIALIVSELGLLAGVRTRWFAAAACVLRSVIAIRFTSENDFLYFIVTAFLLCAAQADGPPLGKRLARVRRWPEDALLYELAWIYFTTAALKLNTAWLSGDVLYVRIRYLVATGWPLAPLLERLTARPPVVIGLAIAAVASELALAALLVSRRRRRAALVLCIGLHTFAALATDVWFFGASMIVQVWALFPSDQLRTTKLST